MIGFNKGFGWAKRKIKAAISYIWNDAELWDDTDTWKDA
jgi:hypothetical protein